MMNLVEKRNILQYLISERIIVYKVTGKSMEPMLIANKDLITIKALEKNDCLNINDVVLYRNKKGGLTFHRIVDINNDRSYVLLGDNCSKKESGIHISEIIGKMIAFKHSGIHYELSDSRYLKYIKELRKNEKKRMRRKWFYDFIIHNIYRFIPSSKLERSKLFLRQILLCNQTDIR